MTDAVETADRAALGRQDAAWLGPVRLAIGLTQGILLSLLFRTSEGARTWPGTVPEAFVPLVLILVFVPVLLLAAVGRMRWTTLAVWIAAAIALLALLGWHEAARQSAETLRHSPFINSPMPLFAAAALFIGHNLILPADMERRWIAAFPTYFDTVWKAAAQLVLSIAFTGAFLLLLTLWADLFRMIGLDFLTRLLPETWFIVPVTTFAFAVAVHLTDVRDDLIRGVRAVGLMLLSWLLLVITVLAAGFVLALPFTGLEGLWDTGAGVSLVLAAVAALVVLINATYQDGRPENRPPLPLRLAVQVAALLLVPLVAIAFWGLALRIGQHGLTPDRIVALACAVVGAVLAGGYAWASIRTALRKGDWMRPLEPTTLAGAALAFVLILALFSPLLDPARLSVADQVARLERGAVTPDKFDYDFLRFGSGKAGEAALDRLTRSSNPVIAARAAEARDRDDRHDMELEVAPAQAVKNIRIEGAPGSLPPSFAAQLERHVESLDICTGDSVCQARIMDLNGDGRDELLIANVGILKVFVLGPDGRWTEKAAYQGVVCPGENAHVGLELKEGRLQPTRPDLPDLVVNGRRMLKSETQSGCVGPSAAH